jgi:GntR family transcriptional regulator/MocR family aminotransferase
VTTQTADRPTPVCRQIHADIQHRIQTGQLQPGDRLPSWHTIAAEYHCSITPVYEAMQTLQHDGWVEGRRGSGTYVANQPGRAA